jgi:hypothetical protein
MDNNNAMAVKARGLDNIDSLCLKKITKGEIVRIR